MALALEAPPSAASSGVRYWRTAPSSGHCPVDLPAMPHPHDQDDELTLHDLVDDAVVPDAQPVTVVVPGKFLDVGIRAARIVPQRRKRLQDRKCGWPLHVTVTRQITGGKHPGSFGKRAFQLVVLTSGECEGVLWEHLRFR
jgi:hypothetical protein